MLFLLLISCQDKGENGIPTPDFGDDYTLDKSHGVKGIHVKKDFTALIYVRYGGGCKRHTFQLQYHIDNMKAYVWLKHDANNDMCQAYIADTIEKPIPNSILNKEIFLLVPHEEDPIKIF